MMKNLKINQKIEVEFESNVYSNIYLSKVADFVDKGIIITGLYQKGSPLVVKKNDIIYVSFTTNRAAYEFKSVILKTTRKPLPLILIKKPDKLKRIQRRNYFRMEACRIVDLYQEKKDGEIKKKKAELIDVSGGGVKIKIKSKLKKNKEIKISFKRILKIDELIKGKIVRTKKVSHRYYQYGIKFIDINPVAREKIIQWTFDLQRQYMKKGLER